MDIGIKNPNKEGMIISKPISLNIPGRIKKVSMTASERMIR